MPTAVDLTCSSVGLHLGQPYSLQEQSKLVLEKGAVGQPQKLSEATLQEEEEHQLFPPSPRPPAPLFIQLAKAAGTVGEKTSCTWSAVGTVSTKTAAVRKGRCTCADLQQQQ